MKFIGLGAVLVTILIAFGVNYFISILVGFFIISFVILFRIKYKKSCIRMEEYKLKKLKEEQKNFVKNAKEDVNFAKTRRLIEKYETEENKESFFNTVLNKKQTRGEKLANFILANDPNKMYALICNNCGLHNGLIDPLNKDVKFFYCYDCKHKNIRGENKPKKTIEHKIENSITNLSELDESSLSLS